MRCMRGGASHSHLHVYLTSAELALFRNPHLIVIYRDPVAVAVRNALSEYFGELDTMVKTGDAMYGLAQFVQRADCPVLLLSYEKALSMPNTVIDRGCWSSAACGWTTPLERVCCCMCSRTGRNTWRPRPPTSKAGSMVC